MTMKRKERGLAVKDENPEALEEYTMVAGKEEALKAIFRLIPGQVIIYHTKLSTRRA
jgi:hypothetical protein